MQRGLVQIQLTSAGVIAAILGGAIAAAGAAAHDSAGASHDPAAQSQPAAQTHDADPMAIFAAPLLREGSHLMEARAQLRFDRDSSQWQLAIDSGDPSAPGVVMTVLPCTRLAEMRRMIESSPRQRLAFIVSGAVYVYRDRNYIVPSHAAVIVDDDLGPESPQSESAAASRDEAPPATSAPSPPANADDSAEAIAQRLRQRTGAVTRSPSSAAPRDHRPQSDQSSRPRSASDASNSAARSPAETILPEGTTITQRRGRITRDGSGGWMFTFDADASGLADPPMSLMPCMLLERIENHARRLGGSAAVLLSGHVYMHDGRNYLMPLVYRVPQERRNLTP